MASADPSDSSNRPAWRFGFRWFLVGFGLLGFAIGFLAGASESPVIGVLLPLLFGLVGGATGFYLANLDLSSPQAGTRLRLLGIALTIFIVPMLLSSICGVMERQGKGLTAFLSDRHEGQPVEIPSLDANSSNVDLVLALMRKRLEGLGVRAAEQRKILEKIAAEKGEVVITRELAPILERLAGLTDQTIAALQKDRDKPGYPAGADEMISNLTYLSMNLRGYRSPAAAAGETSNSEIT